MVELRALGVDVRQGDITARDLSCGLGMKDVLQQYQYDIGCTFG